AVTDDAGDDEAGIVERRAVGVEQGVSQLAALMNGARSLRREVARDTVRPGELPKEPREALSIPPDVRIDLAVRSFQIGVRDDPGPPMTGADDVDHVEVVLDDQPVQVGVDEIEA